jgi:hypothetical protein
MSSVEEPAMTGRWPRAVAAAVAGFLSVALLVGCGDGDNDNGTAETSTTVPANTPGTEGS